LARNVWLQKMQFTRCNYRKGGRDPWHRKRKPKDQGNGQSRICAANRIKRDFRARDLSRLEALAALDGIGLSETDATARLEGWQDEIDEQDRFAADATDPLASLERKLS